MLLIANLSNNIFMLIDAADISPSYPTVLMLTSTRVLQCIKIGTILNDDPIDRKAESFAVVFHSTSFITMTKAQTLVSILKPREIPTEADAAEYSNNFVVHIPEPYSPGVVASTNVTEGYTAAICFSAKLSTAKELLMVDYEVLDITTGKVLSASLRTCQELFC